MLIYFILIIFILVVPFPISPLVRGDKEKIQRLTALFGTLAIFLVLALKSPNVGVDIKGYEQQFYLSRVLPWGNFDYVYFEKGFIFVEKLFSKTGMTFQWFMAIIYFLECSALYLIIRRFSVDARISLMFFVCYQFFVFSTSGLRQTFALSLCVFAFMLIDRNKPVFVLLGIAMIIGASTIHSSAIIFLIVPAIMFFNRYFRKVSLAEILLGLGAAFMFRGLFWGFINQNIREIKTNEGVSFSGSMIFLSAIAFFCLFTYNTYYGYGFLGRKSLEAKRLGVAGSYYDTFIVRLSICSVIFHVLLSGGVMLRGLLYINIMLVPFLPNMMNKYVLSHRLAIKSVFLLSLFLLFYFQTLAVNQLHICPYKFFWE